MPDTEIRTIRSIDTELYSCPVLLLTEDNGEYDVTPCGGHLRPILTTSIVGDDYGSWTNYDVGFRCGHTFEEMSSSLRHKDEV